jgi:DNA-binding NtrC family response regulator
MAEMARILVGDSPALRGVRDQAAHVAAADGSVLISGERGTGKSTVARALHEASPRRDRPLLTVDCASLSDDELSIELFGTTTDGPCVRGRLASAVGGTVVLREVGAIGPAVREGLLRLLDKSSTDPANVRFVGTTAHDLDSSGYWFEQLAAHAIAVPPLRERAGDVDGLCRHFAGIAARRERRRAWEPDPATVDLFRQYAWPRNVRELQNFVDRAYTVSGPENPLRPSLVEPWLRAATVDPVAATVDALAGKPLADIEKQIILTTLQQFRGHRLKTAGALGIGVRTLGIKLKRWRDEGEPVTAPDRAAG